MNILQRLGFKAITTCLLSFKIISFSQKKKHRMIFKITKYSDFVLCGIENFPAE